ncbi:MAG: isoaspartyl peptidase/L-asparaginase [Thermomicrobiales bacterium]
MRGVDERWDSSGSGRLGDSPVIGAGNYADNRFGSAAVPVVARWPSAARRRRASSCTCVTASSLAEALEAAMIDLRHLDDPFAGDRTNVMNIIDGCWRERQRCFDVR